VYPTQFDSFWFIGNLSPITVGTWAFGPGDISGTLFFYFRNTGANVAAPSTVISINQWYQIVGVCNNTSITTGQVAIYVNAKQIGTHASFTGQCGLANLPVQIAGTLFNGTHPYPYYMDNVRIYEQALPFSVIQSQYLAERKEHTTLAMQGTSKK
jgi:hypothetical protein